MILTVVFYIFVAFTGIQIIYYLTFSSFLFNKKNKGQTIEQVPVSVIIFVKNCASSLKKNLPLIVAQNYTKFEIVLINNASTDNTLEVLEDFALNNDNIKVLDVENNEAFWGNKKYALTLGIKAAKHEHLLFTAITSEPLSEFWIAEMSKQFRGKKTITLGYSKYKKKSSLGNLFIRFENLLSALQCFSLAKNGSPFMAFGDNFAYTRSTFFKVKGFINHMKLKYGENDLFLKDAATKKNSSYTISKNSFIEKEQPKSFGKWFHEKRKKTVLKKQYKPKHRFFISFFTISKLLFYVLGSALCFVYSWQVMLPIILTYFLIQFIVIGIAAKKLKEPYLIFVLPFLEIGLLLIQITIFSVNLISKPNHWK
jgi:glycosyltransferase involved in cell wall biosynthesis